jgi:SPP1 family predicted phage head-tail adaptor
MISNATATIYRGTHTDKYGDEIDSTRIVQRTPVTFVQRTRVSNAGQLGLLITYSAVVPNKTDVLKDDRLIINGTTYYVRDMYEMIVPGRPKRLLLEQK